MSDDINTQYEKLLMELRRGTLVLAALSQLDEPQYGYSLKQKMTDHGMEIDEGTLYPLLRRLEKQSLLHSEWDTDGSRPRKYYVMSDDGHTILNQLTQEWMALVEVMNTILQGEK